MTLTRAIDLASLALKFSRVERITRHEDGIRPETDSDHTVMLGIIACDLCPEGLDRGKVAMFALVHDLLEAETGDVQTLTIDAAGRKAKVEAEHKAMELFSRKYGEDSWLMETMYEYEQQVTDEARYVRLLDKVLPKLTHILNRCVAAKKLTGWKGFLHSHIAQFGVLREEYCADLWASPVLGLLAEAMSEAEDAWGRCICKDCEGEVVYESPTGVLLCQKHLDEAKAEAGEPQGG